MSDRPPVSAGKVRVYRHPGEPTLAVKFSVGGFKLRGPTTFTDPVRAIAAGETLQKVIRDCLDELGWGDLPEAASRCLLRPDAAAASGCPGSELT